MLYLNTRARNIIAKVHLEIKAIKKVCMDRRERETHTAAISDNEIFVLWENVLKA
jgi:hypothetical protein